MQRDTLYSIGDVGRRRAFQDRAGDILRRIRYHADRLKPGAGNDASFEHALESSRHENAQKKILEDLTLGEVDNEFNQTVGLAEIVLYIVPAPGADGSAAVAAAAVRNCPRSAAHGDRQGPAQQASRATAARSALTPAVCRYPPVAAENLDFIDRAIRAAVKYSTLIGSPSLGRVEDGRGSLGPFGIAPFPIPAHRTGRADLRHPARDWLHHEGK